MTDEIVLRHQEFEARYTVRSAGYHVNAAGQVHWSVEAELADDDVDFPPELLVAVHGCELPGPGTAVSVLDRHEDWSPSSDEPRAYVYTTFHHPFVDIAFELEPGEAAEMMLSFTATTDDPVYYGDRAQPSSVTGRCALRPAPLTDLWRP